jgi:hypothetical protein
LKAFGKDYFVLQIDKFLNPDKLSNLSATIAEARRETEEAFKNVDMSAIFHELVKNYYIFY